MKKYILFLVFILLACNASAIGVSPPRILLEDIPKGYVLEKSVLLSGIQKQSMITILFSGEGSEWVESKLGNSFVKQDNNDLELPFIITIPEKAPNGEYDASAQIIVSSDKKAVEPNSAAISSGLMVNIRFTVSGKEVRRYSITNVQIPNTEAGLPTAVIMKINNKGNVLIKPDEVNITIKDKEKRIITSSITKDITSVEPYTAGESIASFDLDLAPEFYFADVDIHTDEGIKRIENLPFNVFHRGALKADGEFIKLEVPGNVERIAKIDAYFTNKGEIDMHSVLKAEVYRKDSLIDIIESEPAFVRKGDTKIFTYYYKVPKSCEYTIKARIEFLGKSTDTKQATFTATAGSLDSQYIPLSAVAAAMLAFLVVSMMMIKKREK